ncbi:MAG TPA: hypothetical protein DCR97_08740 [Deltaproteobacteria bacterium]|nr:hypothetical protein [Deltaproteobacteria bacterium]
MSQMANNLIGGGRGSKIPPHHKEVAEAHGSGGFFAHFISKQGSGMDVKVDKSQVDAESVPKDL